MARRNKKEMKVLKFIVNYGLPYIFGYSLIFKDSTKKQGAHAILLGQYGGPIIIFLKKFILSCIGYNILPLIY